MKKIISVVLCVALSMGMLAMLSSCGKNVSKSEFKAIEEAFANTNPGFEINKENMEKLEVGSEDGENESDNVIYNDETDDTAFILSPDQNGAVSTGYVIKQALYKDIDGDGYEEVFTTGYSKKFSKTFVALYDYTTSIIIIDGERTKSLELVARADIPGEMELGFFEDSDGNVHVASIDSATKEVVEDFGVASVNGMTLEIGDYINYSKKSDDFDESCFVTGKYVFMYNGKEITPEKDFAYGEEGVVPPVQFVEREQFEKLIGQSYKALGDDLDDRSTMTINGKEYVSWYTLNYTYNIERTMDSDGEKTYVRFNTITEDTTK